MFKIPTVTDIIRIIRVHTTTIRAAPEIFITANAISKTEAM